MTDTKSATKNDQKTSDKRFSLFILFLNHDRTNQTIIMNFQYSWAEQEVLHKFSHRYSNCSQSVLLVIPTKQFLLASEPLFSSFLINNLTLFQNTRNCWFSLYSKRQIQSLLHWKVTFYYCVRLKMVHFFMSYDYIS